MIKNITLIEDFKYKSHCYYMHSNLNGVLRVMLNDGALAIILYRLGQMFERNGLSIINSLINSISKVITGCVIGRKANFGPGFVLMHPIGVVINSGVLGGEKIVIESGVVIGAARNGMPIEVPVIGNNVFIGSGAKILGGITVGNNTKIGANAVVLNSIPDGKTVVGIPARIIESKI